MAEAAAQPPEWHRLLLCGPWVRAMHIAGVQDHLPIRHIRSEAQPRVVRRDRNGGGAFLGCLLSHRSCQSREQPNSDLHNPD